MHVVHGEELPSMAEDFIDVGAFHGDSFKTVPSPVGEKDHLTVHPLYVPTFFLSIIVTGISTGSFGAGLP